MPTYAIDFETYYDKDCSVTTLGVDAYCRHPDFDAYLVSIAGDDGLRWCGHPLEAPWHELGDALWVSHNAAFDEVVWRYLPLPDRASGECNPDSWECTADLASYCGFDRSLKSAVKQVFGVELSKAPRDDMKGRRWAQLSDEEKEAMLAYAGSDAEWCLKLWQELSPHWPEWERRVSRITRDGLIRGTLIDTTLLKDGEARLAVAIAEAKGVIPWTADGVVLSHKRLEKWCADVRLPYPGGMAEDDPAVAEWEEKYGDTYPVIGALRRYRKANTLLKKCHSLRRRLREDERFPVELKYFGAVQTGRWSGSGGEKGGRGVNIQNLPKKPLEGFDFRQLFIAPEGLLLGVADFSQIEPRCLAWLSGNHELLDTMREGYEIYEAFALNWGLWDGEKGTMRKTHPDLRGDVKVKVLALGYGMGATRFVEDTWEKTGKNIAFEEAEEAVRGFRENSPHVTAMWRKLDREIRDAEGGEYQIELPSGRIIRYHDVQVDDNNDVWCRQTPDGPHRKTWGGTLTENVTQACARDVMADALVRLDGAGHKILFTVHDEVVCEVLDESELQRILGTMRVAPEWMSDLPLDAEGHAERAYRK